jgi:uncharacterized metal-binding protein YceD (DUF177 family)
MKIKASSLIKPQTLSIQGDEPWLESIYESFVAGPTPARLTGELTLTPNTAGFVRVKGEISYTPLVDCSRCAEAIPWPINETIDVMFRPAKSRDNADLQAHSQKEYLLSREDLDDYVMDKGELDLEELINDTVQMTIPLQTVPVVQGESGSSNCGICGIDLDRDQVYGDEPVSDFASKLANRTGKNSLKPLH